MAACWSFIPASHCWRGTRRCLVQRMGTASQVQRT
jgi:hypothetical protein